MKIILLTLLLSVCPIVSFSQKSAARIKFEQAEEAYYRGNYQDALTLISETEKLLKGANTTTIFLKIKSQHQLVSAVKLADFPLIVSLRQNCAAYLQTAKGIPYLQNEYAEVLAISELLKSYPATQQEYDAELKKAEAAKIEKEQKRLEQIELDRKKQEDVKNRKLAHQAELRQKELKSIDFVAFKMGVTLPLNGDAKSTISYAQWSSQTNQIPLTTALKKGEIGLKKGVTVGVNGIKGFKKKNENKKPKSTFGLAMDFSQTFEFYNFNDMTGYPQSQAWYFEEDKNRPFAITSLGVGPAYSYMINDRKTFLQCFFRLDMSLFWGGKYKAVYVGNGATATAQVYRAEKKLGISPAFGVIYRIRKVYLGAEFRLKVVDKSMYTDDFLYTSNGYSDSQIYSYNPKNGINLSYLALNIGFLF